MLQQEITLKQEINDIVEAGALEIQLRFIDFEQEVNRIGMSMILNSMKLDLIEAYYIHKIPREEILKSIQRATYPGKTMNTLTNYLYNL